MAKKKNITGFITWLVAIVTGIVVIIAPLAFFFHSYQNTAAMLETEAKINAGVLTNIISANGDYWKFEEIRLTEYLQNRPKEGILEWSRIVNTKNETVAESVNYLQSPLIMRSSEIMDSGIIVGRLEIYRSLRSLLKETGLLFLLALPIGLGGFYVLRLLPISAMLLAEMVLAKKNEDLGTANKHLQEDVLKCQRFEAELCKLNEELEARVDERTLQLSTEIDERIKVERALTESQEAYRTFLEEAPIGICIADLSGHVQFINRKIEEATGWTREELLSQDALALGFFDEETKQILLERLTARLNGDVPRTTEVPVTCKDSSRIWINLKTTILYKDGLPSGLQVAFLNITERKQAEDALRESEKRYRLLIENSSDLFYTISFRGHFIYVNPIAERIMGWPLSEIVGKHFLSFVRPDFHEEISAFYKKQYDEHTPSTYFEFPIITADGRIKWIGQNVQLRSVNEKVNGFQAVARDITERKQAEEALRESEKKYRELVNFLPLSLFEMDMEGNITSGNPAVLHTFGCAQSDLKKGLNAFQMIIPDDLDRLRANMQKLLLWERKEPTEYTGIRKDGSKFPFMIFSSVIISEGNPVGLRGAIIDLTKQKQAEALLQNSEKKYRELVDFLPIAIYEMDLQGNIISGNPEIFKMFGYVQNDLEKGLNALQSLIIPQDHDRAGEIVLRILSGERTGGSEYTGIRKDGSTFPFLNVASPIISKNKPVGLRGAIIDLTKQKQVEEDLQKAKDMLLQSEKLASIGRLSAGVAHEIRNPVNIISLELQILQTMESLPTTVLEELKVCMDQISRIVTITENLKEFSQIPKRKMALAHISNVIDYVMAMCATQLKIEGIKTEIHYQDGLSEIFMDKEKMEQVIMNLISNSMSFMEGKEKKVLRITTEKEIIIENHDQLKIMIADTGTGIKIEDMPKIFEPFFTTKEPGKGTGLGLSIAYGIIHDHGGRIWAENNEWGGASFYIRLPVKTDANEKSLLK